MFKRSLFTFVISAGLILSACGAPSALATDTPAVPATSEPAATSPAPATSEPAATTQPPATSPAPVGDQSVLVSDHPRNMTPSAANEGELVKGNNAFALALYQQLRANANTENLVFSPYSISQALAMAYAGAQGNTAQQMAAALHFTLAQDRLHPAFNALDLALNRPAATTETGETPFQLNIANSLWGQKDYAFLPPFLDVLAENYGAGLRLADFQNAPEPARQAINQWVSDQTQNKINDLLPTGSVTSDTRLVLANAIYFKAGWQYTFEPSFTKAMPFNLLDGTQANVPMMGWTEPHGLSYIKGDSYQAVKLPYLGGNQSMWILVPDAGQFDKVQSALTLELLQSIIDGSQVKQVALSLPKFSFATDASLSDVLTALGMSDAFKPGVADLSGMDGSDKLFISAVLHKAFVAVDEQGTEAAAATGIVVGTTAMPLTDVQLTVDRPFIFFIRDEATGAILFSGQVINPNKQ